MNQTQHQLDPALTALTELRAAETACTETERSVHAETLDENAPEVGAIRKKDTDALEQFADTEPTTVQGAITKLQYLVDNCGLDIDTRNVRAVIAYLEQAAGVQVADPVSRRRRTPSRLPLSSRISMSPAMRLNKG